MKAKCQECGKLFNQYDKDQLWCNSCRTSKHQQLFGILEEGLKGDYWRCSKCRSLVRNDHKKCVKCGKVK